ncbi:Pentatricopeptide repeat-containing protein [Platanthera guangdongensis]|uniref:Pentatricopeptide repeat-containing protein n=1 Tax=Platanthera guangdongensis TaxID=2320717 RepID=A0ABR2MUS6_9ASPA
MTFWHPSGRPARIYVRRSGPFCLPLVRQPASDVLTTSMALSSATGFHRRHCYDASQGNGSYTPVPSILPSNNILLSVPPPPSRVSQGFKLHCLPSTTSMCPPARNTPEGASLFSALKTLQSKPAEDFSDETIDSLLAGLNPKEHTILLKKQKDWRRSLHLFRRIKSKKGYFPNSIHYNVVFRTLGRSQRWDELRLCWIEMANDGVLPTNNTYATLIDVYGKAGLVKEALLWLKHMKSRGVFPDEVSINTAVQVLKDSEQFDLGERLFKGWCDGKVELDLLNSIYDGPVDSSVSSSKHFLLTELFKSGGRPPISQISSFIRGPQKPKRAATYNTLIDLYGKAGRLKDASDAFLQMLQSGVMPDTITFNTMINICCSHGHLLEAKSLLGKMEEKRIYPDTKTFNIFMTYHSSHGDAVGALRCYTEMKEYGLHPDVVSFRIILQSLCEKKMISEVEGVIEEIMMLDSRVDEQSLPVVMKMYVAKGLLDKALTFFEKHCYNQDISSQNRASVIDLYAERGFWKEAEDVFDAKGKLGFKKDVVEYNVMIKAYGKAKMYDRALELFESMRCTGPWPDECTYNSLVQMLSGGDLPEKAREFLGQMRKSGFTPRCESFGAVLGSYCRAGLLSEAVTIYKEMAECRVEPNELIYGSLVDAFANSDRLDEAIEYYNIMEKSGLTVNCIVLTSLIKAYGKSSCWKEAQELYGKMKTLEGGPDVIASNCMMNLYAGLEMVNEAKLIFDDLRRGGRADSVSYVTITYLYKSMGMLNEAADIAQDMQQAVLLTDCASYNNVMASYVASGKLKECGELLHKMLRQKMIPGSSTFKVLFTVLKKGRFPPEAIFQLETSYSEGKPYARQAVVTSVFSTVGLHNFAQISCEAFANVMVELESYAYNTAIGAYGAAGEVDKALNVYLRMQDEGLRPDLVTYVHLAGCYGKAGMVEGLKRIYSLLKYGEIEPSESLFIALINAYREAGRHDLGNLVNQEMRFSIQTDTDVKEDQVPV